MLKRHGFFHMLVQCIYVYLHLSVMILQLIHYANLVNLIIDIPVNHTHDITCRNVIKLLK